MQRIRLQADKISDWKSFHYEFARLFGFPQFYGRNMNAWIDCMSYLDDPEAAMTTLRLEKSELLLLEIPEVNNSLGAAQTSSGSLSSARLSSISATLKATAKLLSD
ncbi:MAG: barstar family protein [Planctomycetota bacterium]|jgi:hypothetical protein